MADVLAPPTVGKNANAEISQAKNAREFALREKSSVGGDATAVEFELLSPVEIDLQSDVIRLTRWVFHDPHHYDKRTH